MKKMIWGLFIAILGFAILGLIWGGVPNMLLIPAFSHDDDDQTFQEGVRIKKYPGNNACFKFETPETVIVIADPYHMDEIVNPDFVTESHPHADHNDCSKLTGNYKLITTPGTFSGKGITITGISGKHDKGDSGVTNIIFVYKMNGIRIAHFASQGEIPVQETLQRVKGIDVLLIQGFLDANYTDAKLSPEECCTIIEQLRPKIVIPEHGQRIANDLANHFHQKVEYRQNGEFIVTRSLLRSIRVPRIIVLDREELQNSQGT